MEVRGASAGRATVAAGLGRGRGLGGRATGGSSAGASLSVPGTVYQRDFNEGVHWPEFVYTRTGSVAAPSITASGPGVQTYRPPSRTGYTATKNFTHSLLIRPGTNATNSVSLTLTVVEPGEISFWRWISEETNWDHALFSINGTTQYRLTGNHEWVRVVYPLSPGTHTFRWWSTSDSSVEFEGYRITDIEVTNVRPNPTLDSSVKGSSGGQASVVSRVNFAPARVAGVVGGRAAVAGAARRVTPLGGQVTGLATGAAQVRSRTPQMRALVRGQTYLKEVIPGLPGLGLVYDPRLQPPSVERPDWPYFRPVPLPTWRTMRVRGRGSSTTAPLRLEVRRADLVLGPGMGSSDPVFGPVTARPVVVGLTPARGTSTARAALRVASTDLRLREPEYPRTDVYFGPDTVRPGSPERRLPGARSYGRSVTGPVQLEVGKPNLRLLVPDAQPVNPRFGDGERLAPAALGLAPARGSSTTRAVLIARSTDLRFPPSPVTRVALVLSPSSGASRTSGGTLTRANHDLTLYEGHLGPENPWFTPHGSIAYSGGRAHGQATVSVPALVLERRLRVQAAGATRFPRVYLGHQVKLAAAPKGVAVVRVPTINTTRNDVTIPPVRIAGVGRVFEPDLHRPSGPRPMAVQVAGVGVVADAGLRRAVGFQPQVVVGVGEVLADLRRRREVVGRADGEGRVTGATDVVAGFAARTHGEAEVAAPSIVLQVALSTLIEGRAETTALLVRVQPVAAAVAGTSATTAHVRVLRRLISRADGRAVVSDAALTTQVGLPGRSAGRTRLVIAAPQPEVRRPLRVAAAGRARAEAPARVGRLLVIAVAGRGEVRPRMVVAKDLRPERVSGRATVALPTVRVGRLLIPVPVGGVGEVPDVEVTRRRRLLVQVAGVAVVQGLVTRPVPLAVAPIQGTTRVEPATPIFPEFLDAELVKGRSEITAEVTRVKTPGPVAIVGAGGVRVALTRDRGLRTAYIGAVSEVHPATLRIRVGHSGGSDGAATVNARLLLLITLLTDVLRGWTKVNDAELERGKHAAAHLHSESRLDVHVLVGVVGALLLEANAQLWAAAEAEPVDLRADTTLTITSQAVLQVDTTLVSGEVVTTVAAAALEAGTSLTEEATVVVSAEAHLQAEAVLFAKGRTSWDLEVDTTLTTAAMVQVFGVVRLLANTKLLPLRHLGRIEALGGALVVVGIASHRARTPAAGAVDVDRTDQFLVAPPGTEVPPGREPYTRDRVAAVGRDDQYKVSIFKAQAEPPVGAVALDCW